MKTQPTSNASAGPGRRCSVILFVAGDEPNSRMARRNLATLCRDGPEGHWDVRIVDVFDECELATEYGILLTPALLRIKPEPVVMLLGNLNHLEKVRAALRVAGDS